MTQPSSRTAATAASPPGPVICIGAIHQDLLAHAKEVYRPETSTPARLTAKPGGVATNIARTLARLGTPVTLAGTIGADGAGKATASQLEHEGIHLLPVVQPDYPTGQYIAFHNPDGALAAASVDDRILSEAPATLFDPLWERLQSTAADTYWFVDANLPQGLLEKAAAQAPDGRLIANAVSDAKAPRLRPILPQLFCLMLNRGEAAALTGEPVNSPGAALIDALRSLGAKRIVLTSGKEDVLVFDGHGHSAFPTRATRIVDVTGAGDALTAGIIAALSRGTQLKQAIPYGLAAAAITLKSTGALAEDISSDALGLPDAVFDQKDNF